MQIRLCLNSKAVVLSTEDVIQKVEVSRVVLKEGLKLSLLTCPLDNYHKLAF